MCRIEKLKMQEQKFKKDVNDKSPTLFTERKRQEVRFDEEVIFNQKRAAFLKSEKQRVKTLDDSKKEEKKWYRCC